MIKIDEDIAYFLFSLSVVFTAIVCIFAFGYLIGSYGIIEVLYAIIAVDFLVVIISVLKWL